MPSNIATNAESIPRNYDVIVIGAGVAGNPMAVALAKQGKSVLLLERDLSEPDRIVGELLQPGGVDALRRLGMEDCILGIAAAPCYGYKVIIPATDDRTAPPTADNIRRHVLLPYPPAEKAQVPSRFAELPLNVGQGFHHGKFITALRKRATEAQGVTTLEAVCTSLITEGAASAKSHLKEKVKGVNVTVKSSGKEMQFFAHLTVVADGCFSKFRKDYIDTPILVKGHFVGVELKNCNLLNPGFGHVILAHPSPVLLYGIGSYAPGKEPKDENGTPISNEVRALVDIPNADMKAATGGDLKKYLEEKILPQLPVQIQPSFRAGLESRLRSMPNQYLPAPTQDATFPSGLIFVGDAQNMRHPLTGGGMTVGFEDVDILCEELAKLKPAELGEDAKVRSAVRTWMARRVKVSGVVNVLSMALYDLFAAGDDANLKVLRDATIAYFEVGGNCVTGPVSLLAGILKSPVSLLSHFFAVAVYGTFITIKKGGILYAPLSLLKSMQVMWKATSVIFPLGWKEGWSRAVAWR